MKKNNGQNNKNQNSKNKEKGKGLAYNLKKTGAIVAASVSGIVTGIVATEVATFGVRCVVYDGEKVAMAIEHRKNPQKFYTTKRVGLKKITVDSYNGKQIKK